MRRREFLSTVVGAAMIHADAFANAFSSNGLGMSTCLSAPVAEPWGSADIQSTVKPLALGLIVHPTYSNPEAAISQIKELGLSNCFLELDDWIGRFSASRAQELSGLLEKYEVTATSVEIVGPGR